MLQVLTVVLHAGAGTVAGAGDDNSVEMAGWVGWQPGGAVECYPPIRPAHEQEYFRALPKLNPENHEQKTPYGTPAVRHELVLTPVAVVLDVRAGTGASAGGSGGGGGGAGQ